MKSILCRIVQRDVEPSYGGWRSRHHAKCSACHAFFAQAREAERRLRMEGAPANEELCRDIMLAIKVEEGSPASVRPPRRSHPWWLAAGAAAAAVVTFAVILATRPSDNPQAGPPEPAVPPPVVVDPRTPDPEPVVAPAPTLAQLIEQQELLQRDARRLGAHLRERVILFQPVN